MKKAFITTGCVLIIVAGVFLLADMIVLKLILTSNLPHEVFEERIGMYYKIFCSVISDDLKLRIWVCVPAVDVFFIWKMFKSDKAMKIYFLTVSLIYTSFFVLGFFTFQV